MKSIIQLLIFAVAIYLSYQYYKKNYTKKGIEEEAQSIKDSEQNLKIVAEKLKADYRTRSYRKCEEIKIGSPRGNSLEIKVQMMCKNGVEGKINNMDWLNYAESGYTTVSLDAI